MKHLTTFALAATIALMSSCMKEELVAPLKANTPDITPDCVHPFAPVQQVTTDDPGLPEPSPLGLDLGTSGNGHPELRSEHRWPPTIPDLQY